MPKMRPKNELETASPSVNQGKVKRADLLDQKTNFLSVDNSSQVKEDRRRFGKDEKVVSGAVKQNFLRSQLDNHTFSPSVPTGKISLEANE